MNFHSFLRLWAFVLGLLLVQHASAQEPIPFNQYNNIPYDGYLLDNIAPPISATDCTQFQFVDPAGHLQLLNRTQLDYNDIQGQQPDTLWPEVNEWYDNHGCVQSRIANSELVCRMDLGEYYELGNMNWFNVDVTVEIQPIRIVWSPLLHDVYYDTLTTITRTFNLSNQSPEQLLRLDVERYQWQASFYTIRATHYNGPGAWDVTMQNAVQDRLRLQAYLVREYEVDAANEQVEQLQHQLLNEGQRIRLSWDHACSRFPMHEVQLLRLQNNTTATDGIADITATIDWSQALSYEVDFYREYAELVLAEGKGYYVWRVRPIGDVQPGGRANFENWGNWNAAALEGPVQLSAANLPEGALYFDGFDEDRNWTFARTFSEGGKQHETFSLSDGLGNVYQEQTRDASKDIKITRAIRYDYAGRPAVESLPVPESTDLGFSDGLLSNSNNVPFGPADFDTDGAVYLTDSVQGSINAYYSELNPNTNIPSAEGVPFSRTLFHNDGNNQPRQAGQAGETMSLKSVDQAHNAMTYSVQPSEKELLRVFGNDAPAADKMTKTVSIDQNKVINISYRNSKNKVLATCMSKSDANGSFVQDSASHPLGTWGLDDGADAESYPLSMSFQPNNPGTGSMSFELEEPKTVTLNYELDQAFFNSACDSYCATCDYRVIVTMNGIDKNLDPIPFANNALVNVLVDTVLAPEIHNGNLCSAQTHELLTNTDLSLVLPGRYYVNVQVTPAGTDNQWLNAHIDSVERQMNSAIYNVLHADLVPGNGITESINYYLNEANNTEGDLDSLNAYLDSALAENHPDVAYDAANELYLVSVTDCEVLNVPRLRCVSPCDEPNYSAMDHIYSLVSVEFLSGSLQPNDFVGNDFNANSTAMALFGLDYSEATLNSFFDNVLTDVPCEQAWVSLEHALSAFIGTRSQPNVNRANDETDYLRLFVDGLGYQQWEGLSTVKHHPTHGYRSHAHKYMWFPDVMLNPNNPVDVAPNNGAHMTLFVANTGLNILNGNLRYDIDLDGDVDALDQYPDGSMFLQADIAWTIDTWNAKWGVAEWIALRNHLVSGNNGVPAIQLADYIHLRDTTRTICEVQVHNALPALIWELLENPGANPDEVYCHLQQTLDYLTGYCQNIELVDDNDNPVNLAGPNALAEIFALGTVEQREFLLALFSSRPVMAPKGDPECFYTFPEQVGAPLDGEVLDGMALEPSLFAAVAEVQATGNQVNWDVNQALIDLGYGNLAGADGIACSPNISLVMDAEYWLEVDPADSCTLWIYAHSEGSALPWPWISLGASNFSQKVCTDLCWTPAPNVCPAFCLVWEPLFPDVEPDPAPVTMDCLLRNKLAITQRIEGQAGRMIRDAGAAVAANYQSACRDNIRQQFHSAHEELYYYYTLYYYDRAGRLVQTVAPAGVDILPVNAADVTAELPRNYNVDHGYTTQFVYNTLNQVVRDSTPDGGVSNFLYDGAGRLRFSQNAMQRDNNLFSYLKYDPLNRPVEGGTSFTVDFAGLAANVDDTSFPNTGMEQEQVFSHFSERAPVNYQGNPQRFILNKLSYTEKVTSNFDTVRTYYSYDAHGNAEWVLRDLPGLARKSVAYEYDLASGNILKTSYNAGKNDAFYHRFAYDASNRMTKVETSRDNHIWDADEQLEYYAHGPLKRRMLGEDALQGLDMAYTISGQLKGINHPSLDVLNDPGADGMANSPYAPDAFGMQLHYFNGDFRHAGSVHDAGSLNNYQAQNPMYNGNIAATSASSGTQWGADVLNGETAWQYRYDERYRLVSGVLHSLDNGLWTPTDQYETAYGYDLNGNLLRLKRNAHNMMGQLNVPMDNLVYHYIAGTNKLRRLGDQVVIANHMDFVSHPNPNNYTYNASGQLTGDEAEGMSTVAWTGSGKVKEVLKDDGTIIRFDYDAQDNRVSKTLQSPWNTTTTYYVRGSAGEVVAVYDKENWGGWGETTYLREQAINPGARTGNYMPDLQVAQRTLMPYSACDLLRANMRFGRPREHNERIYTRNVGQKRYELKDHLGNVRVAFSDMRRTTLDPMGGVLTASIDTIASQAYYPYGSVMPGSTFNETGYRYGYQGMEKDDEVQGSARSYTTHFRQLNPRIGRWLSIDPKATAWESPYVSMSNNPINGTDVGGDATEFFSNETGEFLGSVEDGMDQHVEVDKDQFFEMQSLAHEIGLEFNERPDHAFLFTMLYERYSKTKAEDNPLDIEFDVKGEDPVYNAQWKEDFYIAHVDVNITTQRLQLHFSFAPPVELSDISVISTGGDTRRGNFEVQYRHENAQSNPHNKSGKKEDSRMALWQWKNARYATKFDGTIAFHFYPKVPDYPASAGCARIQHEWFAAQIWTLVRPKFDYEKRARPTVKLPGPHSTVEVRGRWRGRKKAAAARKAAGMD